MKLICWNCRGTASKGFAGLIKDMKRDYSASFIALLETHTSGTLAMRIAKRTGFENQFIKDPRGQAGGIWIIWDYGTSLYCKTLINMCMLKLANPLLGVDISQLLMEALITLKNKSFGIIFRNFIQKLMALGLL